MPVLFELDPFVLKCPFAVPVSWPSPFVNAMIDPVNTSTPSAVAASRKVGTFSLGGATAAMALACSRIGWKLQQNVSCRSCRSFSPLTNRYRLLCLSSAGPCVFRQMQPSSPNLDASTAPFPCTFKRDQRPEALCPSFQHLQHIPRVCQCSWTISACAPSSFLISPHAENVGEFIWKWASLISRNK